MIRQNIKIIGRYIGKEQDSIMVGGVVFRRDVATDAFVTDEQFTELIKAVESGWFEIIAPLTRPDVAKMISESGGGAGIQGPKGDKGDTGAQGPKGDKGDTGIQGPKGDKGDTGIQGPKGDKGDTGINGTNGKSIELQMNGTMLQWRQENGTWADLVDIATLVTP